MLAAFARWSGAERARAQAAARSSERWLRQQRAESATLAGTLVDLAEDGAEVTLAVGPRRLAGRLVGVGVDLCVLEGRDGSSSLVALERLSALWPAGQRGAPGGGERVPELPLRFVDALAALAGEMVPVRLWLSGGEILAGDLVAAGVDVVTVRLPTPSRDYAYAPVRLIDVCMPA